MAITDLTNTTWKFNETISASGTTMYNINYEYIPIANTSLSGNYTVLSITPFEELDDVSMGIGTSATGFFYNLGWQDSGAGTIKITGGEDVTNPSLIAWLQENAILQEPEEPEETTECITITYNGAIIAEITEGQTVTLHTNGKKAKTDIVVSISEYTNLITFTVSNEQGTEVVGIYQAEEGMTWGQWIDSDYNTDGWYINSANEVMSSTFEFVCVEITVKSVDVIIPDYKYYKSHHRPTN